MFDAFNTPLARTAVRLVASGLAVLGIATAAHAFPTKPVTLVVPFAAGGSNDIVARALAKEMSSRWPQPVIVENVGGAGGLIGTNRVIGSPADGHTILMSNPAILILSYMHKGIEPMSALRPVANVANAPGVVVASAALGVTDMRQLVEHCRTSKDPCSIGTSDPMSRAYGRSMLEAAGIKNAISVSYRGTAPMMSDLRSGQISMGVTTLSGPLPHHRAGGVRIVGVNHAPGRLPQLGDVPTFAEQGASYLVPAVWTAAFVHHEVPKATVERLAAAIKEAIASEEFQKVLQAAGLIPAPQTPEAFRRQVAEQQGSLKDLLLRYPLSE